MFCSVHSRCKMHFVAQQCLRSAAIGNTGLLFFPRLKYSQKALKPISLMKFSHQAIKNRTFYYEQWRSHAIWNRHQFACPAVCNSYRNLSKDTPKEPKDEEKPASKLTVYQRLKNMYKEYWYVLVPVHIVTSCFWFGSFYYLAQSGIDIPALLQKFGAPDSWIENLENSEVGNVVLAYTLYKVATPVRYTVTIGGTTLSINYLQKWGWIRPVPNKAQIKQMYQEQKDVLKDFKATCQDKMQVTKIELLRTKSQVQRQFHEVKEGFHKTVSEARTDVKTTVKEGNEELKSVAKGIKESFEKIK